MRGDRLVAVCCLALAAISATRTAALSFDAERQKAQETKLVERWADQIGWELWRLADIVAQPMELLNHYKKMGARVVGKSGEEIINTISENVGRMLRRKMDAVKCLYKEAERVSEEWDSNSTEPLAYYSAKYSNTTVDGQFEEASVPENVKMDEHFTELYLDMQVEADTHFNNISVNTSHSSVHIPTNVYDRLPFVNETIRWSKRMDRVFKHNYRADPALMWQYFCSTTGTLRMFPAMRWPTGHKADNSEITDIYDCRVRSWFIEASTCSKDMIILVDNSGSMTGMSKTIAKATVATILSTLSNNDFVAVFNFSDVTHQVVKCFQDKMVQATPENVRKFNQMMTTMSPVGVANITTAFLTAFEMLERYRNETRCGPDLSCNQIIMLVTDGIASNITEVFSEWNWFENSTIPVRVFTYLLGKDVTKVREIQWMACLNRGYYTHIHTQAEVPEQVLKYIPVVARPLVLHGKVHPVVWTHAYVDISRESNTEPISKDPKYVDEGKDVTGQLDEEVLEAMINPAKASESSWRDRLQISVSIPVFDLKGNKNSKKRAANLLGVVGTDVPLKDIRKLTLPYKLGVNGYAFIVSNNGYVVLHPALKPDFNGELKLNYNSIDLTEVEILNDGTGPREPGEEITEIRRALVNHECGWKDDVRVKLHYDDYRRVTLESRDYFYAPLPLTPFGIAVVLPKYGRYYIKANKQIEKVYWKLNISDYFLGDNWALHPEWVYCRYHYLEGHEFDTPEKELKHFLTIVGKPSLSEDERYPEQYKSYSKGSKASDKLVKCGVSSTSETDDDEVDCGSDDLEEDIKDYDSHLNDHYCNKELMELLIMDASATNESFTGDFNPEFASYRELVEMYGVFLRFISTQSGLTRWQRVEGITVTHLEERIAEFAKHRRALDEPWYKGAIFQGIIDSESISITVPPIKDTDSGENSTVTISMGIYPHDSGHNASAGVVGFQLPMSKLHEEFMRIVMTQTVASLNCSTDSVDCYLIDQNGYIVVSEAHHEDSGKFFGALDQTAPVMRVLVRQGLFHPVDIYDYLAVCYDIRFESMANILKNPFAFAWNLITWLFARIVMLGSQLHDLPMIFAQDEMLEEEVDFKKPPKMLKMRYSRPCDKKMTLYIVNETNFNKEFSNDEDDCSLPFYARRVPHTNLLLVIVKSDRDTCFDRMDVSAYEIFPYTIDDNITEFPCHKIPLNDLYRRRLEHCYTSHEDEDEIEACGGSSSLGLSLMLLSIAVFRHFIKFLL